MDGFSHSASHPYLLFLACRLASSYTKAVKSAVCVARVAFCFETEKSYAAEAVFQVCVFVSPD